MRKIIYTLAAVGLLSLGACASTENTVEEGAEEVEDAVEEGAEEVEEVIDK